jgi:hypothetical protein
MMPPIHLHCREEFRRHHNAKQKFTGPFFREWEQYVADIEAQVPGASVGRDMSPDAVSALSAEQREQLQRLKAEADASASSQ